MADLDEWDEWDSDEIIYLVFGIFGGLIVFFSICCACCNRRRQQRRKSVVSNHSVEIEREHSVTGSTDAPVVVTTTSTHVPFTPGQPMQHAVIQTNQAPYPVGQQVQGYGMPMPVSNQSYPMPQAGYPPYPAAGAPYPPAGPHESMNPPSYDQVVGSGPTVPTTTNENFAKQSPYNPNYHG